MYAEDLDAFLQAADFAEAAYLGARAITGIFDKAFQPSLDIAGNVPVFTCKSSDAEAFVTGTSTLVIRDSSYLVIGVEDDGTGMALVRLQEAA